MAACSPICRKETERHINELLHPHEPARSSSTISGYGKQSPKSHSYIQSQNNSSNSGSSRPRQASQTVRFTPTPTVHILDQAVWEEEDEEGDGVTEDLMEQIGGLEREEVSGADATAFDQFEATAHSQEDGTVFQDVKSGEDVDSNAVTDIDRESKLAVEDIESDVEVEMEVDAAKPEETSVDSPSVVTSVSTIAPVVSSEVATAVVPSAEDLEQKQLASEIVKKAIGSAVSLRSEADAAAEPEAVAQDDGAV